VVKVISHKATSPPETGSSIVFARWRQCVLPWGHIGATWRIRFYLCFLPLTRVLNPNGKSVGSAIVAQLTLECRRASPNNCPFTWGICVSGVISVSWLLWLIIKPHRSTTYLDAVYCYQPISVVCRSVCHTSELCNKSSAVAEMGDHGDNRDGPKRAGVLCPFCGALGTHLVQCGLRRCLLLYQVASSSIQPFGHNSVGCHSPHRNISTNYYLVVKIHTVTVCSDDARYLLN